MHAKSKITLIGTYAPRQCGIATFTQDLRNALLGADPSLRVNVAMMTQEACGSPHAPEVAHVVTEGDRAGYAALRDELNASGTDVVSLQHEYGIFGGADGAWILDTLRGLRMPVVTTCHTVLAEPSAGQKQVLQEIGRLSARLVVMTEHGRSLLTSVHAVPASKITLIPHGIPDTDPAGIDREAVRRKLGWDAHRVILTTGLVSPNKGLHHVITALPRITAAQPDAIYVIAGATHPNLVRAEGETYRESLLELARTLGVATNVRFIDRFSSREDLVRMIVAADLFVTPYLGEGQITSGVLAYASGLGKPVISTPYWHALELLDESRGILVPFAAPDAIADAVVKLLGDDEHLQRMSATALKQGRLTRWCHAGHGYLAVFDEVVARHMRATRRLPIRGTPDPVELEHLY